MSARWWAAAFLVLTGCGLVYAQSVDTSHLHTPSQIRLTGPAIIGRSEATKGGAEVLQLGPSFVITDGEIDVIDTGDPGPPGQGVAAGGTTGQVLTKQSATDYDTDWETPETAPVLSFEGRTGTVIAQSGDYTVAEVTGAVPDTRALGVGTGLTGGGSLAADRTFALANTAVTPGSYTNSSITVDAQGRLTSAATGNIATELDVSQSGSLVGTRPEINLIAGTNVTLNVSDDVANNRVNITVSSSGSGSGSLRTEIPCTGNITTALLTAVNASEPVYIGPGRVQ